MKKGLALLLPLTALLALGGCYYDNEEELYPAAANDTAAVTYSGVIQPLIGGNCAISGCHIPNNQVPDLSTYEGLTANIQRVKVRAIDERSMPAAGPLTDAQRARLQKWIDAGTPQN